MGCTIGAQQCSSRPGPAWLQLITATADLSVPSQPERSAGIRLQDATERHRESAVQRCATRGRPRTAQRRQSRTAAGARRAALHCIALLCIALLCATLLCAALHCAARHGAARGGQSLAVPSERSVRLTMGKTGHCISGHTAPPGTGGAWQVPLAQRGDGEGAEPPLLLIPALPSAFRAAAPAGGAAGGARRWRPAPPGGKAGGGRGRARRAGDAGSRSPARAQVRPRAGAAGSRAVARGRCGAPRGNYKSRDAAGRGRSGRGGGGGVAAKMAAGAPRPAPG